MAEAVTSGTENNTENMCQDDNSQISMETCTSRESGCPPPPIQRQPEIECPYFMNPPLAFEDMLEGEESDSLPVVSPRDFTLSLENVTGGDTSSNVDSANSSTSSDSTTSSMSSNNVFEEIIGWDLELLTTLKKKRTDDKKEDDDQRDKTRVGRKRHWDE